MHRPFLTFATMLALGATPGLAQQGHQQDSRPAVTAFGIDRLGADGAAAIGAGLRLFPGGGATQVPITPQPEAGRMQPQPAALPLPGAKPAPAAVAPVAGLPAGKPAPLGAAAPAAAPAHAATAFRPDPAVSQRVRQQMLAAALPTSPDPDRLRQAVEAGMPWQEFDRLLRQHGYDPRDLADVVGAFYVIAWEVATGGDATSQPAGIAAVRGQARQMVTAMPALAGMSEADRQAAAETLAFHAIAIISRAHDLGTAGDGVTLASFRTEVAQAVMQQQGIDLRRFVLTASGFQER